MSIIKIENLDTIRQAAKEFIAGMDDRTVFAFYGNMGAGKTTFIKLLCRLYDVLEGCIRINGIDIRDFSLEEYLKWF